MWSCQLLSSEANVMGVTSACAEHSAWSVHPVTQSAELAVLILY